MKSTSTYFTLPGYAYSEICCTLGLSVGILPGEPGRYNLILPNVAELLIWQNQEHVVKIIAAHHIILFPSDKRLVICWHSDLITYLVRVKRIFPI